MSRKIDFKRLESRGAAIHSRRTSSSLDQLFGRRHCTLSSAGSCRSSGRRQNPGAEGNRSEGTAAHSKPVTRWQLAQGPIVKQGDASRRPETRPPRLPRQSRPRCGGRRPRPARVRTHPPSAASAAHPASNAQGWESPPHRPSDNARGEDELSLHRYIQCSRTDAGRLWRSAAHLCRRRSIPAGLGHPRQLGASLAAS